MVNDIRVKVKVRLDEQWASNHADEYLVEFLEQSLNTALGFRGEVKGLKIVRR